MQKEIQLIEGSFEYEAYQMIGPAVKSFLSVYLGDKLLHLEPESYSKIETVIKENIFYNACALPDILYNHRTIKNADEWDKALDNFKITNTEITWLVTQHWFERDFSAGDNEDTFLEDAYDFELNEAQQQAKKIVQAADVVVNDAQNFAFFMRAGYQTLNIAARQFLKDFAMFDLTILSEVGFKELQERMDMMNEMILEDLFAIIID
ncbi:MAG: hypothetical protein QM800_04570 [Paludibacter sp.]